MKIKSLLIIAGFIPAMVMAQQKTATSLPIEKPVAANPSEQMNPNIVNKKAEVKAEVTAKVQAGGINVPVVINPLPGPSGTPKQTQAGDTQTNTVIFNVDNIQHNITHGYQPIIKP